MNNFFAVLFYSLIIVLAGCSGTLSKNPKGLRFSDGKIGLEVLGEQELEELLDSAQNSYEQAQGAIGAARWEEAQAFLEYSLKVISEIDIDELDLQVSESLMVKIDTLLNQIKERYTLVFVHIGKYPSDISMDVIKTWFKDSTVMDQHAYPDIYDQDTTRYDVPIVKNSRVLAMIDFFEHEGREPFSLWLKRSGKYLAMIQQILSEYGLPKDLAYLALIESGFNPKAYSYAHAAGIWQFIPATGNKFGLRKDFWLDERRNPYKSTVAACLYLKDLYSEFQDWPMALAAYNCGEGKIRRTTKNENIQDFWKLRKIPRQTYHYVSSFMAATIIAKNPVRYGFNIAEYDTPDVTETVFVNKCIDVGKLAKGLQIDPTVIRDLNPELRRWTTPPTEKMYALKIPQGLQNKSQQIIAQLPEEKPLLWIKHLVRRGENLSRIAKRYGISILTIKEANALNTNHIFAGQRLQIPVGKPTAKEKQRTSSEATASIKKQVLSQNGSKIVYSVKVGDNLSKIASLFRVSVNGIIAWNNLSEKGEIYPGQKLILYSFVLMDDNGAGKSQIQYEVQPGDHLTRIAQSFDVSVEDLKVWNSLAGGTVFSGQRLIVKPSSGSGSKTSLPTSGNPDQYQVYIVRLGDNLGSIADKFKVRLSDLRQWNNLSSRGVIYPGDRLIIYPSNNSPAENTLSMNKVKDISAATPIGNEQILYYEVKKGDTLWDISNNFGISMKDLKTLNEIGDRGILYPGKRLKIQVPRNL